MGVALELRLRKGGALFLFLVFAAFLLCLSLPLSKEFEADQTTATSARKLLAVKRPCPGCVSFPRNVPNFRTRFRNQQRIPHRPRHKDHHAAAENQLVGRKMLEYQATAVAINDPDTLPNRSGSVSGSRSAESQVRGVHHTDRYVPGGPDPLHHRSTPPSMVVPDLN